MNNKLLFTLLLLPVLLWAQERPLVKGKAVTDNFGIKDILVVNFTGQTETRTDSLGNFTIKAKIGDLLILTDYKIETKRIRFTQDLIENNILVINVKIAAMELEEVVINKYANLTAYKLGITKTDIKLPSVAVRRMQSSGGGPVGMLINAITGQDRVLKNAVQIEKREMALYKIDTMFTDEFYIETLKLNPEQVSGFKYYIVEDSRFRKLLETGQKGRIQFLMADLAMQYLKLNADE